MKFSTQFPSSFIKTLVISSKHLLAISLPVAGLTGGLLLSLSLGYATEALAQYDPRRATQSAPRSGTTTSTTTRGDGCSAASATGLVALAPQTHVGLTQSSQPTFAWFSPETDAYTVEFRVAEHLPNGQFRVIYATEFESTEKQLPSGITTVSLTETNVLLSPNQTYRWQAVVVCNPNRPSESLVTEADIYVVEASADLSATLAAVTDSAERSRLFAESGLWYDAMGEALNASSPDLSISLLEDLVGLEAEAIAGAEDVVEVSAVDRLQEVINRLR